MVLLTGDGFSITLGSGAHVDRKRMRDEGRGNVEPVIVGDELPPARALWAGELACGAALDVEALYTDTGEAGA